MEVKKPAEITQENKQNVKKLTYDISRDLEWVTSDEEREELANIMVNLVTRYKLKHSSIYGIPTRVGIAKKSKFDQVYDACRYVAYPAYKTDTIIQLFGEGADQDPEKLDTKIWKCFFDVEFKIVHIMIRAVDFQTAFAKANDYVGRVYLKRDKTLPRHMTIKVEYVTETVVRSFLRTRKANRIKNMKKRNNKNTGNKMRNEGIEFAALGHPKNPEYSIYKHMEQSDLLNLKRRGIRRISSVETESYSLRKEII